MIPKPYIALDQPWNWCLRCTDPYGKAYLKYLPGIRRELALSEATNCAKIWPGYTFEAIPVPNEQESPKPQIVLEVITGGLTVRQWDSGEVGLYCQPGGEMTDLQMILTLAHRIAVLESAAACIDSQKKIHTALPHACPKE